jgi:hypothetical protein
MTLSRSVADWNFIIQAVGRFIFPVFSITSSQTTPNTALANANIAPWGGPAPSHRFFDNLPCSNPSSGDYARRVSSRYPPVL